MAKLFLASNWVVDTQLTDFTAAPTDGADWAPHPDYVGTLRGGASNKVFSNPQDTDEALYICSAPSTADFEAHIAFGRYGSGAIDNTIGFCYRVQVNAKSYYRIRYNGTDWLLEKVVAGVPTTLATVATPDLSTVAGTEHLVTVHVVGSSHTIYIVDDTGSAGRTIMSAVDSTFTTGYFGLWGSCGGAVTGTAPSITPTNGVYIGYASTPTSDWFFGIGTNVVTSTIVFSGSGTGATTPSGLFSVTSPVFTANFSSLYVGLANFYTTAPKFTAVFTGRQSSTAGLNGGFPRAPRGSFSAILSNKATFSVISPKPTVSFTAGTWGMGARCTHPVVSFTANLFIAPTITARAPKPTASFTGTVSIVGSFSARVKPSAVFVGRLSLVSRLVATSAKPYAVFSGFSGSAAGLVGISPVLTASFAGRVNVTGAISVTAPSFIAYFSSLKLFSTLTQTVVINTRSYAHSTYSYGFLGYAKMGSKVLGIKADGIYELDIGNTDGPAATNIDAEIATGQMDFDIVNLKHMDSFYATYKTSGDMTVLVSTDEGTEYSYPAKGYNYTNLMQRKVTIGRGLRGKNYKIKFRNVNGASFELDSIDLIIKPTQRGV